MTQRTFLMALMVYAVPGSALPVNILHTSSLVQQAREGLNETRPPLATLQPAWDSTYLLYFEDREASEWGSAFVIRNERQGDTRTLDLVTADHVLRKYCRERRCGNYSIYTAGHIFLNPRTNQPQHQTVRLGEPNLRILARDEAKDLAVIRITVEAEVNPRPLTIARDASRPHDRVWVIGYPNVALREDTAGIDDPNHVVRRWSEGLTLGGLRLDANNNMTLDQSAKALQAHTADALPGASGGPLLNDQGEVIGVLAFANSWSETNYAYATKVDAKYVPSVAVELGVLRSFLADAYRPGRTSALR